MTYRAPSTVRALTVAPAVLLALGGLALLAGCRSDEEARPSPLPPGYAALLRQQGTPGATARPHTQGGQTVDELFAVVDGQVLTRREALRAQRLAAPTERDPDADVEEELEAVRLAWARQRLVMGAARRAGLRIPDAMVDTFVRKSLRDQMRANEQATGEVLPEDEYLRRRGMTWNEFREQIYGGVVTRIYLRKLYDGIGGTRPVIDLQADPHEVRRIYHDHREKFDQPAGVKLAILQVPVSDYERDGRDYLDAEAEAQRQARVMAEGFRAGGDPEALWRQHGSATGQLLVPPDFIPRFRHPEGHAWLFAPERRARDAHIFSDHLGPFVLGVIETRPARKRTLPEVYDKITELLVEARLGRLEAHLMIDLLAGERVVWPDELTDALLDEAHATLGRIEGNPVVGRARLR